MNEEAAQRRAALAGRAHRSKGDAAQRQIEIGRRRDDRRIVAAELQNGAGEALARAAVRRRGPSRSSRSPRPAATLGWSTRASPISRPPISTAERPSGAVPPSALKRAQRAFEQRLRGERGQRRLLRRLPDDAVAADQRERGIPCPDRDREIERRDDAGDAERMPALHHAMLATFGRDGQAIELAGQPDGEIADVDHLLDFAEAFGRRSCRPRSKPAGPGRPCWRAALRQAAGRARRASALAPAAKRRTPYAPLRWPRQPPLSSFAWTCPMMSPVMGVCTLIAPSL